ncbi:MAG TPA: acetate--CoA ligase family protein, partial [Smithellaceae bacterium]|nr:acetate--CoA ligase family protein [Smithellaceae bacterium]
QPHAAAGNPVDMTFDLDMPLLAITIPEIIMKSGEVDALVLHGAMGRGFMKEAYDHAHELVGDVPFAEFFKMFDRDLSGAYLLPQKYNMPLIVSSFFDREDNYTQAYQDNNVPVFDSPERAARALISLYQYALVKKRKTAVSPALPPVNETAANIISEALARNQKALDEYAAKKLLAAYGIPVVQETLTATPQEALAAAKELGFPVALKACSWEIMHKSGKGLIALNVENEEKLKIEFKKIQQAAGKAVPLLVQQMISGSREFLAGMTRFAGFGPCVVFGLGGIFTEALHDTTIRLAPLALEEAREMIADIRAQKLLSEFRGMPKVNTDTLALILQAVGFIALLHPEIAEIDLNPIIIEGAKPVVADALIVLST